MKINKTISVIIPMKNEGSGLTLLFDRLLPILNKLVINYEIVIINDGSTDDTLEQLLFLQRDIATLKIVDLSRNFGKEAALYAGFDNCSGDCAVALDADLQDPPELIVDMVASWLNGFEVITAVRESRNSDSYFKRNSAGMFYKFMNKISDTKLTANAGDYRLLDRCAITAFLQLNERVRFNKGLLTWIGFKEKLLYHVRNERVSGKSQWNYWRLFKLSVDGITSFSKAPLEIWFYLGIAIASLGFGYAMYYLIRTILFGIDVHGYPSLLIFILMFSGLQMIGIGILGKYIGRIFIESKRRPIYLARRIYSSQDINNLGDEKR